VASHIVPWSQDKQNRLRPTNGLCLNALHDRAFDKHLITVSAIDFTIRVSARLKARSDLKSVNDNFLYYEGKSIRLPDKAMPSIEQLKQHNEQFRA
jgi:putative restriction endonuclease